MAEKRAKPDWDKTVGLRLPSAFSDAEHTAIWEAINTLRERLTRVEKFLDYHRNRP